MQFLPSIKDVVDMSNGVYKPSGFQITKIEIIRKQNIKFKKKNRKKRKKLHKKKLTVPTRPKYYEYIKSKKWFLRRRFFFEAFGEKCAICAVTKKIDLHHISYEHLGNERDEELVALCRPHHSEYHERYGVKKDNIETHNFIDEERQALEFAEIVKTL